MMVFDYFWRKMFSIKQRNTSRWCSRYFNVKLWPPLAKLKCQYVNCVLLNSTEVGMASFKAFVPKQWNYF